MPFNYRSLLRRKSKFDPDADLVHCPQANTPLLFQSPDRDMQPSLATIVYPPPIIIAGSAPTSPADGRWRLNRPVPVPIPVAPCQCPSPWVAPIPPVINPPTRNTLPEWVPRSPVCKASPLPGAHDLVKDMYHYGVLTGYQMSRLDINKMWKEEIHSRYPPQFWDANGM
jgi:hypothetical protein